MSEKFKIGAGESVHLLAVMALVAVIALGGVGVGFLLRPSDMIPPTMMIPAAAPIMPGGETVIVPLTSLQPILTTGTYQGVVTLLVSGSGQVNGTQVSDAFYTYLDGNQQPRTPPMIEFYFVLELDGQNAQTRLNITQDALPYSSEHTYLLRYDVGSTLRHIALRTADSVVTDNTGQLEVTVLPAASWLETMRSFVPTAMPTAVRAREGGEIVTVAFDRPVPVYTEHLYSGTVTLLIHGIGQAGGSDWSDAFYLYERGDGRPFDPPTLGQFAMELDGDMLHIALGTTPPYNADHVYRVAYDAGSTPRPLAFRNTDLATTDNRGLYTVEIIGRHE